MAQQLASSQIAAARRIYGYSNYKVYTDTLLHVGNRLPSHSEMFDVLPKVILIDQAYSTNLRFTAGVYKVAKSICFFFSSHSQLPVGRGIVNEIAKVPRSERVGGQSTRAGNDSYTLLSFASKYCHFFVGQGKSEFPIYDSLALMTLKHHYEPKRGEKLWDYEVYCNALNVIVGSIDQRPDSCDLDHYLWLRGRLLKDPDNGPGRLRVSLAIESNRKAEFEKDLAVLVGQ